MLMSGRLRAAHRGEHHHRGVRESLKEEIQRSQEDQGRAGGCYSLIFPSRRSSLMTRSARPFTPAASIP